MKAPVATLSWVVGTSVFALTGALFAQADAGVRDGWHIVRPGENLHAIAQRYLGDERDWQLLAELNPQVGDPDLISPGQRIRVRVINEAAPDTAQLNKVSRRVEEQMLPHDWSPATERNFLNTRDGIRTFESASAELVFSDASKLVINEDTLVFLGRSGEVEEKVRREEIEIIVGQADLEGQAGGSDRQLIVGESVLTPTAGPDGRSQTRARRPEEGGAELMVYEGESVVESGGAVQAVARGMGTTVRDGEPPEPPEALLPAAVLISPQDQSQWPVANPPLSWEPTPGAAGYVAEICYDAECARLAARYVGLGGTSTRPAPLEAGAYFWRVTAVAASGLDGYPSGTHSFTVESGADDEAPVIAVSFTGTQFEEAGRLALGGDAELELSVKDEGTGLKVASALLDGEPRELDEVGAPWADGAHELVVIAEDRAGNEARRTVSFHYDATPPTLRLLDDAGRVVGEYRGVAGRFDNGPSTHKRSWRLQDLGWRPPGERRVLFRERQQRLRGMTPTALLGTDRRRQRLYSTPDDYLRLSPDGGASLTAIDEDSEEIELRFRVELDSEKPQRRRWLVVESEDRFGNLTSTSFELWRGSRSRPF